MPQSLLQNDAKRARADKKFAEEAAARSRIESEIAFLTAELAAIRAENASTDRQLSRLRRYARYLESVVVNGSAFSFDNPGDVLQR